MTENLTTAQRAALAALAKAADGGPDRYWTATEVGAQGATMLALANKGYARMSRSVAVRTGHARPSYKVTLSGLAILGRLARAERERAAAK